MKFDAKKLAELAIETLNSQLADAYQDAADALDRGDYSVDDELRILDLLKIRKDITEFLSDGSVQVTE